MLLFLYSCSVDENSDIGDEKNKKNDNIMIKENQSKSEFILDTIINISVYEGPKLEEEDWNSIFALVRNVDFTMSSHRKDSEISKINLMAGKEKVEISEDTYKVLLESIRVAELCDGSFDPTIGALSTLWAIGTENERIPENEELEEAKKKVSYKSLILGKEEKNGQIIYTAFVDTEGISVDVGGIAKGYSADLVKEYLEKIGVKRAILDFGGNIQLIGQKSEDKKWYIGLQNPFNDRGEPYAGLEVADETVVTSGDYERFFEKDGKRYHHIIDPKTALPTDNELRSVSIITKSSMTADAYSTACMVLGLEKGKKLVENTEGLEAVFILKNGNNIKVLNPERVFKEIEE